MKREALIALAKESGLWEIMMRYTKVFAGKNADAEDLVWTNLRYFAALVAAAERKKCVEICELLINNNGSYDQYDEGCWDCAEWIRDRSEQFEPIKTQEKI